MKNRDILIIGAIILVGAVSIELFFDWYNPFIDYAPGPFTSLTVGTPQRFDYYKDGTLIGTYSYTLTAQTSLGHTLYTLDTTVNATYQGNQILVNTTHRFLNETTHVSYSVDSKISGAESRLDCSFVGGNVIITSASQKKNATTSVALAPDTVLIDNNDAAHWELLMKSFTAEEGKRYHVNTLVPQGGNVQQIEFGVDSSDQYVNIGSRSYDCVVAREPNFEITLYFYQGSLIEYRNDVDGVVIVKRLG